MKVCVLGAGIAGLSSALLLQQRFPHAQVVITADKFSPEVTSDVAAGFWQPYLCGTFRRWCSDSFKYVALKYRENPSDGVILMHGYTLNEEKEEKPFWGGHVWNFRELSRDELVQQGYGEFAQGFFFTTFAIETSVHLKAIMNQFLRAGGQVQRRRITSLDELDQSFDVIVNCTGLGSRELFGDLEVFPTRGQVIRVRCPAVKTFFNFGTFYCLLNRDTIVLGGTHEENDWDLNVRPETARQILDYNSRFIPALKVPVVHNYGHGGSGITLSYGCAQNVVRLVEELPIAKAKL